MNNNKAKKMNSNGNGGIADIDAALVHKAQDGDKYAFELLVLRYTPRITGVVSSYIKEQADAYDVVQETFIRAYVALDRFRFESTFYTWLYRIAINACKTHFSRSQYRTVCHEIDSNIVERQTGRYRQTKYCTPENFYIRDELKSAISMVVEDLPAELRIAMLYHDVEGLSYEEIADVTHVPIGTVRSRIFRAREAIMRCIAPFVE